VNNIYRKGAKLRVVPQSLTHVEKMIAMGRGCPAVLVHDTAQLAAVAPVRFEGATGRRQTIAPAAGAVAVITSELHQLGAVASLIVIGFGPDGAHRVAATCGGRREAHTRGAAPGRSRAQPFGPDAMNATRSESAAGRVAQDGRYHRRRPCWCSITAGRDSSA
jgi:hypothetical protein